MKLKNLGHEIGGVKEGKEAKYGGRRVRRVREERDGVSMERMRETGGGKDVNRHKEGKGEEEKKTRRSQNEHSNEI